MLEIDIYLPYNSEFFCILGKMAAVVSVAYVTSMAASVFNGNKQPFCLPLSVSSSWHLRFLVAPGQEAFGIKLSELTPSP